LPKKYDSIDVLDNNLVQLQCILSTVQRQILQIVLVSTSSGMVSGILSKTRSCPARYKPLVRQIFAALGSRKLEVHLELGDSTHQPHTPTLELLRQAYFTDHQLDLEPEAVISHFVPFKPPDFASAL
jgi:hypothetical protein